MEKNNQDKFIEEFTQKHLKVLELEEPSVDFTENIMEAILVKENSDVYQYKPLISKKVWAFVLTLITGLIFAVYKSSVETSLYEKYSWLKQYSFSSIIELPSFSLITVYACVIFSILMSIQILYLKNTLNNINVN